MARCVQPLPGGRARQMQGLGLDSLPGMLWDGADAAWLLQLLQGWKEPLPAETGYFYGFKLLLCQHGFYSTRERMNPQKGTEITPVLG